MKSFICKQKNCFITLATLIVICELLLKIDNKFIQSLGILILPFIIYFGYLLIRNDQKKIN